MPSRHILPFIVVAQFCCTSLWFAGNAVMEELLLANELSSSYLGYLTSSVQLGFIVGTLSFAILTVTDRFSPSKVFLVCALLGASANLGLMWAGNTVATLLGFRVLTGFFLAGIYPVGMKIAADYYSKGLGRSLGFLVGALVLGTAFPHLIKFLGQSAPWNYVIIATSTLAASGGLLIGFGVPNGPNRIAAQGVDLSACFKVFRKPTFRAAAFGYFGHMWELYAFWAFLPIVLTTFVEAASLPTSFVSLLAFVIIGVGGIGCVLGGYSSERFGVAKTAAIALAISGACCLVSPVLLGSLPPALMVLFFLIWGMSVVADSPLFSTMVANCAPAAEKGTALTVVNCIGFTVTIVSIQLLNALSEVLGIEWLYLVLALGPLFGLISLRKEIKLAV